MSKTSIFGDQPEPCADLDAYGVILYGAENFWLTGWSS